MTASSAPRLRAGGTLREGELYIPRDADDTLFAALRAGRFCHVLAPRQSGKSSLRLRTQRRLEAPGVGVRCVTVDLTAIGVSATVEQWYRGLLQEIAGPLGLDADRIWKSTPDLGPVQRWTRFLREELVRAATASADRPAGQLVVFIDEIDTVLALKGNAASEASNVTAAAVDDFFASIRAVHNEQADRPELGRVAFCVLGVALPGELMSDAARTPFNIDACEVALEDFTRAQVRSQLEARFTDFGSPERLLDAMYDWTAGHPYMTLRLCVLALEDPPAPDADPDAYVKGLAEGEFLAPGVAEGRSVQYIEKRVARTLREHERLGQEMLAYYLRVLREGRVTAETSAGGPSDAPRAELRIAGLISEQKRGDATVVEPRNRILSSIFNEAWVVQRQGERELRDLCRAWLGRGKTDDLLLRGDVLKRAEAWAKGRFDLTNDEQELLERSRERAFREREEELTRARERAETEKVRTRNRYGAAVVAVLVVAVLGAGVGLVTINKKNDQLQTREEALNHTNQQLNRSQGDLRRAERRQRATGNAAIAHQAGRADEGLAVVLRAYHEWQSEARSPPASPEEAETYGQALSDAVSIALHNRNRRVSIRNVTVTSRGDIVALLRGSSRLTTPFIRRWNADGSHILTRNLHESVAEVDPVVAQAVATMYLYSSRVSINLTENRALALLLGDFPWTDIGKIVSVSTIPGPNTASITRLTPSPPRIDFSTPSYFVRSTNSGRWVYLNQVFAGSNRRQQRIYITVIDANDLTHLQHFQWSFLAPDSISRWDCNSRGDVCISTSMRTESNKVYVATRQGSFREVALTNCSTPDTGELGSRSFLANDTMAVTPCRDHFVVWQPASPNRRFQIQGFSPSFVVAQDQFVLVGAPERALVLDLNTSRIRAELVESRSGWTALAVSVDGTRLFTGHSDGSIREWPLPEVTSGVLWSDAMSLANVPKISPHVRTEHRGAIRGFFRHRDGRLISWSGDDTIRIWNLDGTSGNALRCEGPDDNNRTGCLDVAEEDHVFDHDPFDGIFSFSGPIYRIDRCQGPPGEPLLTVGGGQLDWRDPRDAHVLSSFLSLNRTRTVTVICRDGTALVALRTDRSFNNEVVRIERVHRDGRIEVSNAPTPSDRDRLVPVLGTFGVWVRLHEKWIERLPSGGPTQRVTFPENVERVEYSADGSVFAVVTATGGLYLWRPPATEPDDLSYHLSTDTSATLSFSHDTRWFACGGDREVLLRDLPRRESQHLRDLPYVKTLAFSEDGRWLAGASSREVGLWDLTHAPPVYHPLRALSEQGDVGGLRFSMDGEFLLTFSTRGAIRLWNTRTSSLQRVFNATRLTTDGGDSLNDVALSSDSRTLWAATNRGLVTYPLDLDALRDIGCRTLVASRAQSVCDLIRLGACPQVPHPPEFCAPRDAGLPPPTS